MLLRMRSVLYRFCLAYTDGQPANVDDLYQKIVSKLWNGWGSFRNESDEITWVYRVAINTVRMEYREQQHSVTFVPLDSQLLDSLADDSGDEQLETLYHLIDRLPDLDKQITLLYIDDLTHAQIADLVGLSENAVKQRIYRIKLKLHKMYIEDERQ